MVVVFETVTERVALAWLPAASRAMAVNVNVPFANAVLLSVAVNGEAVSVERTVEPARNSTEATPTLSEADAVRDTEEPLTVAPLAGAVNETVGSVVSVVVFETVTERVTVV